MATEVKDVVARLRTDAGYLRHRSHETLRTIGGDCDIAADLLESLSSQVPQFTGIAKTKLDDLTSQDRGWTICGYAIEKGGGYGLVTTGGFVGWWTVASDNAEAAESRATAAEGRVALLEVERDEMTVAANDYAHQAAKAMLRERELSETLAAFVQRFEIYAGPNDMHAGKHDLELLTLGRARLAKGGQ